jgi:hypothetical protein
MNTFGDIQGRYQILKGDTTSTTADVTGKSHINWSVKDILNRHPFSWSLKTANLTLSSGTANLPTDINPKWSINDARIAGSSQGDDHIFTQIDIKDRDRYSSDNYVYWITWDSSNNVFVFNTHTQTGTVAIYYNHLPADMTLTTAYCLIPDGELVAYKAASKNWIGDERNVELKKEYDKESEDRIKSLIQADLMFGPDTIQGSVVDLNSGLINNTDDFVIARS